MRRVGMVLAIIVPIAMGVLTLVTAQGALAGGGNARIDSHAAVMVNPPVMVCCTR